MSGGREKRRMTLQDVEDLMELRDWSRTDLASNLDLCEAAIHKWFRLGKVPGGPGAILMRQWLAESRADKSRGKAKRNGVPA